MWGYKKTKLNSTNSRCFLRGCLWTTGNITQLIPNSSLPLTMSSWYPQFSHCTSVPELCNCIILYQQEISEWVSGIVLDDTELGENTIDCNGRRLSMAYLGTKPAIFSLQSELLNHHYITLRPHCLWLAAFAWFWNHYMLSHNSSGKYGKVNHEPRLNKWGHAATFCLVFSWSVQLRHIQGSRRNGLWCGAYQR